MENVTGTTTVLVAFCASQCKDNGVRCLPKAFTSYLLFLSSHHCFLICSYLFILHRHPPISHYMIATVQKINTFAIIIQISETCCCFLFSKLNSTCSLVMCRQLWSINNLSLFKNYHRTILRVRNCETLRYNVCTNSHTRYLRYKSETVPGWTSRFK